MNILTKPRRSLVVFTFGFLILGLLGAVSIKAQTTAAPQIRPTEKPFLWRIEGPVPSYLYGTIHVPEQRVLALPDVVRQALNASDVFHAEIPLDTATQMSLLGKIMLPPGQDLRKIAGESVFARLVKAIAKVAGSNLPGGSAEMLAATLATMKPWAVMSQVELLEFLPDIAAGRQPLDSMLYSTAEKAGKELGALETVEEQIAVFEGFTDEEQVRMLVTALEEIEKPRPSGSSAMRELVDVYLTGDLDRLASEANSSFPEDEALSKKMLARVVDDRNTRMAVKIAELCARKPARSHFFAVGALHFSGETGIITQLAKKGVKTTRLGPKDVIARKPAA